jgi:hypothetical protein
MATMITQISEVMLRHLWEGISRRSGDFSDEDPNGLRHRWVREAPVKGALERFIDSPPRLQRSEPPLLPNTAEMSRRMPPIKIFSVTAVHKVVMSRAELGRPGHEVGKKGGRRLRWRGQRVPVQQNKAAGSGADYLMATAGVSNRVIARPTILATGFHDAFEHETLLRFWMVALG